MSRKACSIFFPWPTVHVFFFFFSTFGFCFFFLVIAQPSKIKWSIPYFPSIWIYKNMKSRTRLDQVGKAFCVVFALYSKKSRSY